MIDAPVHQEVLFFDDFQHQSVDVSVAFLDDRFY